ncbi:MAG: hypothetical protein U9R48_07895, partial [Chloroflexota bacterium]|nr:hypothetical protein [Chloroflexota bacterium]
MVVLRTTTIYVPYFLLATLFSGQPTIPLTRALELDREVDDMSEIVDLWETPVEKTNYMIAGWRQWA